MFLAFVFEFASYEKREQRRISERKMGYLIDHSKCKTVYAISASVTLLARVSASMAWHAALANMQTGGITGISENTGDTPASARRTTKKGGI